METKQISRKRDGKGNPQTACDQKEPVCQDSEFHKIYGDLDDFIFSFVEGGKRHSEK